MRKFKSSKAIKLFAALILFLSSFTYMACSNSTSGASSDDEKSAESPDTPNTPADTGAKNNKSSNDAFLTYGVDINNKFRDLDPTSSAKHFSKSPSAPGKNVEKVKISSLDSPIPVYMWKDNDTIYYYADTPGKIYLDSDACLMFSGKKFETIDLSSFDTSKVTDMSKMFSACIKLTSLNLASFNTSNVTNMSLMFDNCVELTSLNLASFNTSKVTNMSQMFNWCGELTSLDLSSFDTSKVTDMSSMFYFNENLTTIEVSENFVTTKVTADTSMFEGCTSLKGGNNTSYNVDHIGKEYARIDKESEPGYFTLKQ